MLSAFSLILVAAQTTTVQSPPSPTNPSLLIYLLGAALGGGLIKVGYDAYTRWKRGPIDDDEQIGRTLRNELGGMKELLEEYRVEQKVTERRLDDYRRQLVDVTSHLADARIRIEALERQLENARERRNVIESELRDLRSEYKHLEAERDRIQREAGSMTQMLAQLARITGRPVEELVGEELVEKAGGDIAP